MRSTRKILLIAIILIIIGLIGSALTYASANDKSDWESENVTLDPEGILNIDIDSKNAKVEIVSTDNDQVKVEYKARNAEKKLITEVNHSTLSIQAGDKSKKWFSF